MANTGTDYGAVLEALNEKMDRDVENRGSGVETVVETWHEGTSWYRVWSDGWCEQGGQIYGSNTSGFMTVSYHKPFVSEASYIGITLKNNTYAGAAYLQHTENAQTSTSTGFTTYLDGNLPYKIWEAKGYIS